MQVHEHGFFESSLTVPDPDGIVVAIQSVNESLNRGLVEVAQVGSCLPGFLTKHERLWVDEAEGVNDNLALDRLDGIDDHGDGTWGELFKGLLSVDIDGRKPAAEAGM